MEIGNHAFSGYDEELNALLKLLNSMTETADQMIGMVYDALQAKEISPEEARGLDKIVGKTERDVIDKLHSILTKYPASVDELRFLISTVKIAASLDKMGDLSTKTVTHISQSPAEIAQEVKVRMLDMTSKARSMLKSAASNITDYESEVVAEVLSVDDQVNYHYSAILKWVGDHSVAQDISPASISKILLVAKDIERIADHAFEIARLTYFVNEGKRARKKKLRKQMEE